MESRLTARCGEWGVGGAEGIKQKRKEKELMDTDNNVVTMW